MGYFIDSFVRGGGESSPYELVNHVAATGGAWARTSQYPSGTAKITADGALYAGATTTHYVPAATDPPSANYRVRASIRWTTLIAQSVGVTARAQRASNTYLWAVFTTVSTTPKLQLQARVNNGASVILATYTFPGGAADIPLNVARELILTVDGSRATVSLDGVTLIDVTQSYVSGAGTGGILCAGSGSTASVGPHLLDYWIEEIPETATAVSLTGPATAVAGEATAYTLTMNGRKSTPVTVTPSDSGAGGTFAPAAVVLDNSSLSASVSYTPAAAQAGTTPGLTATDDGGLTDPAPLAVSVGGQRISLAGPASGPVGAASSAFTVSVAAAPSGAVTVTPSDSGGGGTFTPSSVALSAGTLSASFTYTPAGAVGARTITVANNGGLSNPAAAHSFTVLAAQALSLTAPKAYQVHQRNRYSETGGIPISGSYYGLAGERTVEARLGSGAWADIDVSSDGTFSGSLVAGQGQGTLEVRIKDATAVSASVAYVGVGEVILCIGQSNMSGRGTTNQALATTYAGTLKASCYTNAYAWAELSDPYDSAAGALDTVASDPTAAGSYAVLLAGLLMTRLGVPVALIPGALGGTAITRWAVPVDHRNRSTLYGSAVNRALSAGGVGLIVWHQGENDATAGTASATYAAALEAISDALHADLGVRLTACKIQLAGNYPPADTQQVNNGIQLAWDSGAVLEGPDLYTVGVDDGVHMMSDANLMEAAQRWALALRPQTEPVAASYRTLHPDGCLISVPPAGPLAFRV